MQQSANPIRLIWPPPGLESCQGVLWRKAGELGFGATILVLPFILSLSWSYPFNSLGPFGGTWWVLALTSLAGSLIVLRALAGVFGFFWKARQVARHGIDLETAMQVGADNRGDMGALLQGTRDYFSLEEALRIRAIRARIWSVVFFLSAATWIAFGWVVSLLLATRGLMGPTGVWVLTLGPAAGTLLAGTIAMGVEGTAVHPARGPFFWNRWNNAGRNNAAEQWGNGLRQFRRERGEVVASGEKLTTVGLVSVLALALFMFIPTASLTVATSTGSALATMAIPRFSATQQRAGAAAALERYRIPPDPKISPLAAGEALHVLASAGREKADHDWFNAPVRQLEEKFLPEGYEDALGILPAKWHIDLFPLAAAGLSSEAEGFLRRVARHPGLGEFEVLGQAEALDVLGARYPLPLPEEASYFNLPIPRLSQVREGSYAMVARAVVQFLDGDAEGAEFSLRATLSAGLLLGQESPTLIDALIGYVMVGNAGDALAGLFEATGRQQEAEALRWVREATQATGKTTRLASLGNGTAAALQRMPGRVLDTNEIRGVRWEYFMVLAGLSPCLNPRQVMFGPDRTQAAFMESARSSLVRYPSEAAVWEVMKKGFFDLPVSGGLEAVLAKAAGATLGPRAGSCAAVLASGAF